MYFFLKYKLIINQILYNLYFCLLITINCEVQIYTYTSSRGTQHLDRGVELTSRFEPRVHGG